MTCLLRITVFEIYSICMQGAFNTIHVHENGICAPYRLVGTKFDPAKALRLEDGTDIGFENPSWRLTVSPHHYCNFFTSKKNIRENYTVHACSFRKQKVIVQCCRTMAATSSIQCLPQGRPAHKDPGGPNSVPNASGKIAPGSKRWPHLRHFMLMILGHLDGERLDQGPEIENDRDQK